MNELHIEHYGDVIICPYDKSHVIPAHRIQTHLIKCQKQHPHAKLAICIFNATHHVPEEHLKNHQRNCPDRALIELDKYMIDNSEPNCNANQLEEEAMKEKNPYNGPHDDDDENWEDMDAPPYNPQLHCLDKPIIRKAVNMTRSERRKFRAEESARHRKLFELEDNARLSKAESSK